MPSALRSSSGATLDLNFMTPGTLDPSITFTRASTATYTDATGTIQTAAVNAPRWDYTGGALRGLLIEEARANVVLFSADFGNANWSKPGSSAAPVVTVDQVIAPDGTMTADQIVYPAVPSAGNYAMVSAGSGTNAAVYAFSVWLRGAVGGEQTYVMTTPDGATYYRTLATLTTQWQRFTLITGTLTAATWFFAIGTDRRDASQVATGASMIYAWGAQVEQGAFATSYTPTTAAAVTRAADIMTLPTNVSWYSGTAGTLMVNAMLPANGNNGYRGLFCLDGGVGNVWLRAYTITGSADINCNVNTTDVAIGTMTPGTPFKMAVTYAANGTTSALNGNTATSTAERYQRPRPIRRYVLGSRITPPITRRTATYAV